MNAPAWSVYRDRILSKTAINDECWDWTGSLDGDGYARIAFRGKNHRASRVSWSAFNEAEWPDGKMALHSCDNRRCVNPKHIRPGTNRENIIEAWERGGLAKFRRTHCPRGHPYVQVQSAKYCRECSRQKAHIYNARAKVKRQLAREKEVVS